MWQDVRKLPPWFWGVAGGGALMVALLLRGRGSPAPVAAPAPAQPRPPSGTPALAMPVGARTQDESGTLGLLRAYLAEATVLHDSVAHALAQQHTLQRSYDSLNNQVLAALGDLRRESPSANPLAGDLSLAAVVHVPTTPPAAERVAVQVDRGAPPALFVAPSFQEPVGGVLSGVTPDGSFGVAAGDTSPAMNLARLQWAEQRIAAIVASVQEYRPDYTFERFMADVPDSYAAVEYQRALARVEG